jgi:hypothetical protein
MSMARPKQGEPYATYDMKAILDFQRHSQTLDPEGAKTEETMTRADWEGAQALVDNLENGHQPRPIEALDIIMKARAVDPEVGRLLRLAPETLEKLQEHLKYLLAEGDLLDSALELANNLKAYHESEQK